MGPPQVLPGNLPQREFLSPRVSRSLPGAFSSPGFPRVHNFLSRHPLASLWVFFTGCRCISESLRSSLGCRGRAASPRSHHGVQENLSSSTWSTSFPSFSTDPAVCRAVHLTSSHLSLLWLQLHLWNSFFFPFLNITKVLRPFLIGPALISSTFILEPSGSGSAGHG